MCVCVYTMDSAIEKDEILQITVTWTDLKGIKVSEMSQKEKRQNTRLSLSNVEYKETMQRNSLQWKQTLRY